MPEFLDRVKHPRPGDLPVASWVTRIPRAASSPARSPRRSRRPPWRRRPTEDQLPQHQTCVGRVRRPLWHPRCGGPRDRPIAGARTQGQRPIGEPTTGRRRSRLRALAQARKRRPHLGGEGK
jgi:hypothetical protein